MKKVVMLFAAGKPTKVEVEGVAGPACRVLSAPYEAIAGREVVSDVDTAEMQQVPLAADAGLLSLDHGPNGGPR